MSSYMPKRHTSSGTCEAAYAEWDVSSHVPKGMRRAACAGSRHARVTMPWPYALTQAQLQTCVSNVHVHVNAYTSTQPHMICLHITRLCMTCICTMHLGITRSCITWLCMTCLCAALQCIASLCTCLCIICLRITCVCMTRLCTTRIAYHL